MAVRDGKELIDAKVATQKELDAIWEKVREDMTRNLKLAIDDNISPHIPLMTDEPDYIADLMFSKVEHCVQMGGKGY